MQDQQGPRIARYTTRGGARVRVPVQPQAQRPQAPSPAPAPQPDAAPITEFWFVWAPVELCPKKRHPTLAAALAEAKRLRSIAPQKTFHVFHAQQVQEQPT